MTESSTLRSTARRRAWVWLVVGGVTLGGIALVLWWREHAAAPPEAAGSAAPGATAQATPGVEPATPTELLDRLDAELRQAEQHYEAALTTLSEMARAGVPGADARLVDTLKGSVAVADRAIAEGRAALESDPQNQTAAQSVFEALRRKVSLLQDTIALVNEMRKGNQAGAAQIVKGLKPS